MSTTNEWIKFSERQPRDEDYPVWVAYEDGRVGWRTGPFPLGAHWQRAIRPEPPKEEAQREKDEAAFMEWQSHSLGASLRKSWLAAVAHERAEVQKILDESCGPMGTIGGLIDALRKRCTP